MVAASGGGSSSEWAKPGALFDREIEWGELTEFAGNPAPGAAFGDWREAVDALLRLGEDRDRPVTVVLDEFSYLMDAAPPLTSIVQNALSPRGHAKTRTRTRTWW
ncbi:hypothetical protein [Planobispora takensis]